MFRLDQYYTAPAVAERYVAALAASYDCSDLRVVEPSAGEGAFVRPLRGLGIPVTAIDVDPRGPDIRRADFLRDGLLHEVWPGDGTVAVVGNPPFGRVSSLAVRFFNRAAERATIIAFILPRTFRKRSIQNRLCRDFWLSHDEDVPPWSFVKEGRPHDVPCAWQIWERRQTQRAPEGTPDVSHLIRFTRRAEADIAFLRVGGRSGQVLPVAEAQGGDHTFAYIKVFRDDVPRLLAEIDWTWIRDQTAGVRSISQREIAVALARRA